MSESFTITLQGVPNIAASAERVCIVPTGDLDPDWGGFALSPEAAMRFARLLTTRVAEVLPAEVERIRATVERLGWTVEGIPDDLTGEQAADMMIELMERVKIERAAREAQR